MLNTYKSACAARTMAVVATVLTAAAGASADPAIKSIVVFPAQIYVGETAEFHITVVSNNGANEIPLDNVEVRISATIGRFESARLGSPTIAAARTAAKDPRTGFSNGRVQFVWNAPSQPGEYHFQIEVNERGKLAQSRAAVQVIPRAQIPASGQVTIHTSSEPMFLGSFAKIPVSISANASYKFDDLDFFIPLGTSAGTVSMSRDTSFDPAKPDFMLLAGYEPGAHRIQAIHRPSGTVVGNAEFVVASEWPRQEAGPSFWSQGDFELPGILGATWGGGSFTDPENYKVNPTSGTHQVAILLVDTKSQRYTTAETQATKTRWEEAAFNGHVVNNKKHPANGIRVSTAHYFREVSNNAFDIEGKVFGPVSLSGVWDDYIQTNGKYKQETIWSTIAKAADSLIDYKKFDHLVCVFRAVDATATANRKSIWASASSVNYDGNALGTVIMHHYGNPFDISGTLAHELGHNFGLGDIYPWGGHTQYIKDRQLSGMAIMAYQEYMPIPTLAHRMMLGWVPKDRIKLYNFQNTSGFIDATITLTAAGVSNPPAGSFSGAEIRIAPNWNYYFEYRSPQPKLIGDQALYWMKKGALKDHLKWRLEKRVLGTDVEYGPGIEDRTRRKPVMVLAPDYDGNGGVLAVGDEYTEQDISPPNGPNFPTDFSAKVISADATSANLRIRYGVYSQPDPSIRPWSPPVYQSPDIEVFNERNKVDPRWRNVPWENHLNTVVAKVTNRGKLSAPGVIVDFFVKDYTLNSGGIQPAKIGEDRQDVPAGSTVEFRTEWRMAKMGHYCVEARIRLYQTPGANSKIEVTEYNNRAQSNYNRFISSKASPASRETATVKVKNPLPAPARVLIRSVKSTSPLYRTFLEHTWLDLRPGETRDVNVMFEYAMDPDTVWIPELERYIGLPNDVSIQAAIASLDSDPDGDAPDFVPLGGVNAQIVTGRKTQIIDFAFDPAALPGGQPTVAPRPLAMGRVVTVGDGQAVSGGHVILTLERRGEQETRTVTVAENGRFIVDASGAWERIEVYYVPLNGFSDATSNTITR